MVVQSLRKRFGAQAPKHLNSYVFLLILGCLATESQPSRQILVKPLPPREPH